MTSPHPQPRKQDPDERRISKELRSPAEVNAFSRSRDARPELMVNGGFCQGKTATFCDAMVCFEDDWLELHDQAPGPIDGAIDDYVVV